MNSANKVAFYLPSARGGGAEKMTIKIANEFSLLGGDVYLVFAKAEGIHLNSIAKNINVVDLDCKGTFSSIPRLLKFLNEYRPEVIISAMKHANIAAIISTLLSKAMGCKGKVIISERSNASSSLGNNKNIKTYILKVFMRLFYKKADFVIGISDGVSDDIKRLARLKGSKVTTVYNPIVDKDLLILSNQEVTEEWFNKVSKPVILSVGRLTKAKGFDDLLFAFKIVKSKLDCHLVILGEGEERENLSKLVSEMGLEDSVIMPGYVNNPYKFMRNSDLFVLSSLWEGFGNVLVEAIACGTKVVTTNCPSGPKEIVERCNWGHLCESNDTVGLAEAMLEELNSTMRCKVDQADVFSVQNSLDGYIRITNSVINNS